MRKNRDLIPKTLGGLADGGLKSRRRRPAAHHVLASDQGPRGAGSAAGAAMNKTFPA
jgi:hypothetical protein